MICPNCKLEFQDYVKVCPDCRLDLVEAVPISYNPDIRHNWFEQHLNWTLFFVWLLLLATVSIATSATLVNTDFAVIAIWIVLLLFIGVEIWVLVQKKRSGWWLLFGPIIILCLSNKRDNINDEAGTHLN